MNLILMMLHQIMPTLAFFIEWRLQMNMLYLKEESVTAKHWLYIF